MSKEIERLIKLVEDLPEKISEELSKISFYTTSIIWAREITVKLDKARSSPELLGYYAEGGDCIVALPDSDGNATLRIDSSTAHGYLMGSGGIYKKIRVPFSTIYIQNSLQPEKKLYLVLGRGDINVEKWS